MNPVAENVDPLPGSFRHITDEEPEGSESKEEAGGGI